MSTFTDLQALAVTIAELGGEPSVPVATGAGERRFDFPDTEGPEANGMEIGADATEGVPWIMGHGLPDLMDVGGDDEVLVRLHAPRCVVNLSTRRVTWLDPVKPDRATQARILAEGLARTVTFLAEEDDIIIDETGRFAWAGEDLG